MPMTLIFEFHRFKPERYRAKARRLEVENRTARRLKVACIALALVLSPVLGAQQKETGPVKPPGSSATGPITSASRNLPRVFISAPDSRAYDDFYAAMKKLGQYELVNDPAHADQIFETRFIWAWHCINDGMDAIYDPRLELGIRDRKTNALRGPLVVNVKPAILARNQKKNYAQALDALVKLAARMAVPAGTTFVLPGGGDAIEPPPPAPFSSATTVFISPYVDERTGALNAPEDVYQQVYETMQKWGRYKLVSSAAEADLSIDLAVFADSGQYCKYPGDPKVELRMMVPKTQVVVSRFTEPLAHGSLSYRQWGTITSIHSSQKDVRKTADALVARVRRQAARGDAAANLGPKTGP
jgi:hypothetical protein